MAATLGPSAFKFEHALPAPWFNFSGSAGLSQIEGASTGLTPPEVLNLDVQRVIQTDQPCYFRFRWSISGLVLPSLNPFNQWHLQIYFEQLGGGEITLPSSFAERDINVAPGAPIPLTVAGTSYDVILSFPANAIPEGLYEIVGVVRMMQPNVGPPPHSHRPLWVAAFAELGKVQFYKDNP